MLENPQSNAQKHPERADYCKCPMNRILAGFITDYPCSSTELPTATVDNNSFLITFVTSPNVSTLATMSIRY